MQLATGLGDGNDVDGTVSAKVLALGLAVRAMVPGPTEYYDVTSNHHVVYGIAQFRWET